MDSADWEEHYSRHFPLESLGKENQKILQNKTVLVAGMGGLGTVSSELLASIGVGKLIIVDYDVVERSNLPRQKLYTENDIGKSKVDVAEERLRLRNPFIEIVAEPTSIDAISSPRLLDGVDLVIDGLDRFSTRKILHRATYNQKIPFIFAGAVGTSANILAITHNKEQPCLECVLGNVKDNPDMRCEITGVHPGILHLAAGLQVTEAVKILLNQRSNLIGTMMFIDLETLDFEKIKFVKNPDCTVCSEKANDELDTGKVGEVTKGYRIIKNHGKALVTSLCGRDTLIIDPKWQINWDFEVIKKIISNKWSVITEGKSYSTFNVDDVSISLLKSGVATIRGSKSSNNAILYYKQILDEFNKS